MRICSFFQNFKVIFRENLTWLIQLKDHNRKKALIYIFIPFTKLITNNLYLNGIEFCLLKLQTMFVFEFISKQKESENRIGFYFRKEV